MPKSISINTTSLTATRSTVTGITFTISADYTLHLHQWIPLQYSLVIMLSKQLNKNHYGRVCQSRLIPGEGPRYFTHNIYVLDLKGNIIAQPKQSNKIISIERWTYPFHIYFSTYVAVHLVRTQQLIKYIHDIHLDAQFNSWRTTSVVMAHNPSHYQSQCVYAHQCLKYNGSHP